MLAIIGLIPVYALWAPNIVWKLFDMFIGLIQAFIFALLTVIYFGMAGETHDELTTRRTQQRATRVQPTLPSSEAATATPELSGAH